MTHDEIMQVEYYDQLPSDQQRKEYRENTLDITAAVGRDMDRIDAGLKAECLS